MVRLLALIRPYLRQTQEGQGLAEYALILTLIALVAIIALMFIGTQLQTVLSNIGNSV